MTRDRNPQPRTPGRPGGGGGIPPTVGRWVGWAMAGLGASGLLALVLYAARSGETELRRLDNDVDRAESGSAPTIIPVDWLPMRLRTLSLAAAGLLVVAGTMASTLSRAVAERGSIPAAPR